MVLSGVAFAGMSMSTSIGGVAHSASTQIDKQAMTLKQVQVCFRHGARTPYRQMNMKPPVDWHASEVNDKYKLPLKQIKVIRRSDETGAVAETLSEADIKMIDFHHHKHGDLVGGVKPARLTKVGMQQAISLGERLRDRYSKHIGLLSSNWSEAKDALFVRSTETERTIETAQGVLTGMYPDSIDEPAEIFLKYSMEQEWAVPNFQWCPRLDQLYNSSLSRLKEPSTAEAKALLAELRKHVKMDVPEKAGAYSLSIYRDQLNCGDAHGKPRPHGIDKVENAHERLADHDAKQIVGIFSGGGEDTREEATRLVGGRMIARMIDSIENHSDSSKKMVLYSGHDWSILMLLMCLDPDQSDPRSRLWPTFCSDLAIEVWEAKGVEGEVVRVLLDGEPLVLTHLDIAAEDSDGRTFYTFDSLKAALDRFVLADDDIDQCCELVE